MEWRRPEVSSEGENRTYRKLPPGRHVPQPVTHFSAFSGSPGRLRRGWSLAGARFPIHDRLVR
jgi:hypothetical protein